MKTLIHCLVVFTVSGLFAIACSPGTETSDGDSIGLFAAKLESTPNLVANPSFETANPANPLLPNNWTKGGYGTNTVTLTYDTSAANTGSASARIDMTARTDGDAKWIFDPVAVTAGITYIYADYYKATIATKISAIYTMADNTKVNATLYNTVPAAAEWTRLAFSFTPPANATRVTIFHLIAGVGTVQVDDVRVALPQPADLTSGVPNGDLEQTQDLNLNLPLAWQHDSWGTNTPTFAYDSTGHSGSHSVSVTMANYTDGDAKWYFDPQPVTAGTRYLYSDYYTSTAESFITARVTLADGTYKYLPMGKVPASAPYTQAKAAFLAPANATAVTVFHGISQNGFLRIDDATLEELPPVQIVNGVPNGDFEQASYPGSTMPAGWYPNNWGVNTTVFTYLIDASNNNHYARIDVSAYSTGSSSWYFDAQPVQAGKAYRLTETYRSDVDTSVQLLVTLTDGTAVYLQLPAASASPAGASYSAKIYMPDNAVAVTLYHMLKTVGYLEIDNVGFVLAPTAPFTRGLVSLTFDDSWITDHTNALPVLAAHGAPATHYTLTGSLGDTDRMTIDMLPDLVANGDEIGSHTVNHYYYLTTLSPEDLMYELLTPVHYLEANGFGPVVNFASPGGVYNDAVIEVIKTIYRSHRTVDVGFNSKDDFDAYRLKVQNMRSTTTVAEVLAWAARAAAEGSWLILVYHDVVTDASTGTIYSTTQANLDAQLTAIRGLGLAIVTVQTALDEIEPQMICNDNNVCTDDALVYGYCQFTNNALACDDANPCTVSDACSGGVCQPGATPPSCGLFACDPALGCRTTCISGGDCAASAYCKNGACVSSCDDGDPCTADEPDANGTCVSTVQPDGTACGDQAQCHSGFCRKLCTTAADCSSGYLCQANLCVINCNDNNPCTTEAPDISGANCVVSILQNGTSCDDGNACTTGDSCQAGACVGGAAISCDDGSVCTVDTCNPSLGCVHAAGNAGLVCRAAAGSCDIAETCTGTSTGCPSDQLQPSTVTCRAAQNACDSAEQCTGASMNCPADVDRLAPTLSAGTNQTLLGACLDTSVRYVVPTVSNSAAGQCDSAAKVTCTPVLSNSFGANTVTCTAKDANGNVSAPVAFRVTVLEPLTVKLQSSLSAPSINNVARVGWTVLHSVKLSNCSNEDVTATAAVDVKLTTAQKTGYPSGVRNLSQSTATPDTGGAMKLVGTGSAATYRYKLGTTGMARTGLGTIFDSRYWLSTMTASYKTTPTVNVGSTTARLALRP